MKKSPGWQLWSVLWSGGSARLFVPGLIIVGGSVFMREPSLAELRPIEGRVQSTTAIVGTSGGSVRRYEFTLSGHSETYWSYHEPANPTTHAPNAQVVVYAQFRGASPKRTLSRKVKTYGLVVDGITIEEQKADLDDAHVLLDWVLPAMGLALIGIGIVWLRRDLKTKPSSKK